MRAAAALDVERLRDAGLVAEAGFAAVELSGCRTRRPARPSCSARRGSRWPASSCGCARRPAAAALAELEPALDAVEELAGVDPARWCRCWSPRRTTPCAAAAGEVEQHRYLWTRGAALGAVLDATHRAAERCQERGLVPAFLPRPGSAIESPREIDALAGALDLDLVRLALDVEGLLGGLASRQRSWRSSPKRTVYVRVAEDLAVVAPLAAAGYVGWITAGVPPCCCPRIGARTARGGRRGLTPRRMV